MKKFNYKRIFTTPVYRIFVITILVDACLKFFLKEHYNIVYSFLMSLIYGIQDDFVAVKLREVLGFGPIHYLRAIEIGIIAAIKLFILPMILTIAVIAIQSFYNVTYLNEFPKFAGGKDNFSFLFLLNIALSWVTVGVNYAFFTNNTSNITWRTFKVLRNSPKKVLLLIICYILLMSVGSLSRQRAYLDIVVGIIAVLMTSVPLRAWAYKIFSEVENNKILDEFKKSKHQVDE